MQFTPAVSLRKVFVDTGSYIAPQDHLQSAVLQGSFNNKNERQTNRPLGLITVFDAILTGTLKRSEIKVFV